MSKLKSFLFIRLFAKESSIMAEVYATLIIKGVKTFKQVPKVLQPKVREILIALDLEELAN